MTTALISHASKILSYNDKLRMQTLWQVSHCLVYAERLNQSGRLDCRLI